jgi:dimethylhistidine N-methyltransferase
MHESLNRKEFGSQQYLSQARMLRSVDQSTWIQEMAHLVATGLSSYPKSLPSSLLYDSIGSALFDSICQLREYECMRAELRSLKRCAHILTRLLPASRQLIELGGASGGKMAVLLSALAQSRDAIVFHNIDVSAAAMTGCIQNLAAFQTVRVCPHICTFEQGLEEVAMERHDSGAALFAFLGSSIGNFEYQAATRILRNIRSASEKGDILLLGMDLIKPLPLLMAAYDDPQGVTSAFNKNLLARINHDLGADFNLRRFTHQAKYNENASAVEMHLRSETAQRVSIQALGITVDFAEGETILTEQSHKYAREHIAPWLATAGFETLKILIDETAQFADVIARAV